MIAQTQSLKDTQVDDLSVKDLITIMGEQQKASSKSSAAAMASALRNSGMVSRQQAEMNQRKGWATGPVAGDAQMDRRWLGHIRMDSQQGDGNYKAQMPGFGSSYYRQYQVTPDSMMFNGINDQLRFRTKTLKSIEKGTLLNEPMSDGIMIKGDGEEMLRSPVFYDRGEVFDVGVEPSFETLRVMKANADGKLEPVLDLDANGNVQYSTKPLIDPKTGLQKQDNDGNGLFEPLYKTAKAQGTPVSFVAQSGHVLNVKIGDRAIRHAKDVSGIYLDRNGDPMVRDQAGNRQTSYNIDDILSGAVVPISFKREKDANGQQVYYEVNGVGENILDANGQKQRLTGQDLPKLEREGVYTVTGVIDDVRTAFVDRSRAGHGMLYENHYTQNRRERLTFKEVAGANGEKIEIIDVIRDKDGNVDKTNGNPTGFTYRVGNGPKQEMRGYGYHKDENGRKSLIQIIPDYAISGKANGKATNGPSVENGQIRDKPENISWRVKWYELDNDNKVIPEWNKPKRGEEVADYFPVGSKKFRHYRSWTQPHGSDVQSGGASTVAMQRIWLDRHVDNSLVELMRRQLDVIGITPLIGVGRQEGLAASEAGGSQKDDASYNIALEAGGFDRISDHATRADPYDVLQWQQAYARSYGNYRSGMQRLMQGAAHMVAAGAVTGTATSLLLDAATGGGFTAANLAVSVATAAVAGLVWHSKYFQHTRGRKDNIEMNELQARNKVVKDDEGNVIGHELYNEDVAKIYSEEETLVQPMLGQDKKLKILGLDFTGLANDAYTTLRDMASIVFFETGGQKAEDRLRGVQQVSGLAAVASAAMYGLAKFGELMEPILENSPAIIDALSLTADVAGMYLGGGALVTAGVAAVSYTLLKANQWGNERASDLADRYTDMKWVNYKSANFAKHMDTDAYHNTLDHSNRLY